MLDFRGISLNRSDLYSKISIVGIFLFITFIFCSCAGNGLEDSPQDVEAVFTEEGQLFQDDSESDREEELPSETGESASVFSEITYGLRLIPLIEAEPLPMDPLALVVPGSSHGVRVSLEGDGRIYHQGEELLLNFELLNDDAPDFPPLEGEGWDYFYNYSHLVYIHDQEHDIDSMGLWIDARIEIVSLSSDRRRGTFRVTIPYHVQEGDRYIISMIDGHGGYGHTELIAIWAPSVPNNGVRVTEPNGGVHWPRGTEQTLTWRYYEFPETGTEESGLEPLPLRHFAVEVLQDGEVVDQVDTEDMECNSETKTCSLPWLIPEEIEAGSYKIRVRNIAVIPLPLEDGIDLSDESDSTFRIVDSFIRVRQPNEGQGISVFERRRIGQVSFSQFLEGTVSVKLFQYGYFVKVLYDSLPVPSLSTLNIEGPFTNGCGGGSLDNIFRQGSGSGYTIRVEHNDYPHLAGESEEFIIFLPRIRVLSPRGGETWRNGEDVAIEWEFHGVADYEVSSVIGNLNIILELGNFMGRDTECVVSGLPPPAFLANSYPYRVGAACDNRAEPSGADLGGEPWATGTMGGVPEQVPPGSTYRLRIRSQRCPAIQGLSAEDFTITN